MIFGYSRAFAHDLATDKQVKILCGLGVPENNIFVDKVVSRDNPGIELKKLLTKVSENDVVVVDRLACLARTTSALIKLINDFEARGIHLILLQESIDTRESSGNWLSKASGVFEQFLGEVQRENIVFGQKTAKQLGRKGGRRSKISSTEADKIRKLVKDGMPVATVAKKYSVERTTIYRIIKGIQQTS